MATNACGKTGQFPSESFHSQYIAQLNREMAEELAELKGSYREQWLAENRPYWLDSVLARYDQAIAI
jgi:hypothetical protein